MRALLVIDEMPKDCGNCPCVCEEFGICQADKKNRECDWYDIPIWCPLKSMPMKSVWKNDYSDGWNGCLDEIMGEIE